MELLSAALLPMGSKRRGEDSITYVEAVLIGLAHASALAYYRFAIAALTVIWLVSRAGGGS